MKIFVLKDGVCLVKVVNFVCFSKLRLFISFMVIIDDDFIDFVGSNLVYERLII